MARCAASSRCTYLVLVGFVLLYKNTQDWEISKGNAMILGSDRVPQATLQGRTVGQREDGAFKRPSVWSGLIL